MLQPVVDCSDESSLVDEYTCNSCTNYYWASPAGSCKSMLIYYDIFYVLHDYIYNWRRKKGNMNMCPFFAKINTQIVHQHQALANKMYYIYQRWTVTRQWLPWVLWSVADVWTATTNLSTTGTLLMVAPAEVSGTLYCCETNFLFLLFL